MILFYVHAMQSVHINLKYQAYLYAVNIIGYNYTNKTWISKDFFDKKKRKEKLGYAFCRIKKKVHF